MTTPTPPEAQDLPALPEAAAFNCYWKGDNDSISWDQWHDASDPMPAKWTAGEEPDKVTAYYTADQMRAYARAALAAQQAAPSDGAIYAAVSERASPEWHAGFRAGLSAGQACAAAHARQPAQAPTTDTGEQR